MSVRIRPEDGKAVVNVRDINGVQWIRVFEDINKAYEFHAEKTKGLPPKGQRNRLKQCDKNQLTVGQFIDLFIQESRARLKKKEAKWKTICRYLELRAALPEWLAETPVRRLTPDDCREYLAYLTTCPQRDSKRREIPGTTLRRKTIKDRFALFKGMLEKACDDLHRVRADNPARNISLPHYTKAPQDDDSRAIEFDDTFRPHELAFVLKIAARMLITNQMYFVLICIMAFAGLRPSEAIALKICDWDFDGRDNPGQPGIHVRRAYCDGAFGKPKTWVTRTVDMDRGGFLFTLVRRWVSSRNAGPYAWLFPSPSKLRKNSQKFERVIDDYNPEFGLCIDYNHFWEVWERIMDQAEGALGRRLPPYALRHAFATNLFNEGAPIEYISRQMGHASIATTERVYTKWGRSHDAGARRRVERAIDPPAWPFEIDELARAHHELQALTRAPLIQAPSEQS